jgi:sulfonate transport system substrate-binding protein
MSAISRRAVISGIALSMLLPGAAHAADALKEIRIDWATYNPVSMVLKQNELLEKEFDRFRLDRGLGGAGRQDQR